jgi:hypothetical protein
MFETLENMQQIVAEYTTPAGEAQAIIGHWQWKAETGQLTGEIEAVNNEYQVAPARASRFMKLQPKMYTYQIELKPEQKRTANYDLRLMEKRLW